MVVAVLGAAALVAGLATAAEDDVVFVNVAGQAMIVIVKTGSSGEVGTCEAKPNRSRFDLAVGARHTVKAGRNSVCYCSVPEKDGPPKADSACSWNGATPGDTVEIR
jgi:hypothetical protein